MASHPYAPIKLKTKKPAAAKQAATQMLQADQKPKSPAMETAVQSNAKGSATRVPACISQAKHQRLVDMLRDLRIGAEALSANADGLLSRIS